MIAAGWAIEALATPGHTANHMVFALKEANLICSGDHVMAWSTSIVAPPDGAMSDFMNSLHKLARRPEPTYLPDHGGEVRDAPNFVAAYCHSTWRHSLQRQLQHSLSPMVRAPERPNRPLRFSLRV